MTPYTVNQLLAVLLLALGGCQREEPISDPIELTVEFPKATVLLVTETDTVRLGVEVAETDQQRSLGLMQRTSLAADSGMIFIFPQEQRAEDGFWMYNTLIPLSAAFIGEDGRIVSLREMEPCTSPYGQWCPTYASGVPFRSAIEVNSGYFADKGVGIGDRVVLLRE